MGGRPMRRTSLVNRFENDLGLGGELLVFVIIRL